MSLQIPIVFELIAVITASVCGALTACERKLDFVGAVGLALLCGLGGGLIRDTIMQCNSVYILKAHYAIPVCVVVALLTYYFHSVFNNLDSLIEWLDLFAIGLFAATGTDKALVYDIYPVAAIFLGLLTANGGGLLRDVFLGDVPKIFIPSNYYALCGLAGSFVYWLLVDPLRANKSFAAIICVVVAIGLRRLSLRFNITTTTDIDLTPKVIEPIKKAAQAAKDHSKSRRN